MFPDYVERLDRTANLRKGNTKTIASGWRDGFKVKETERNG